MSDQILRDPSNSAASGPASGEPMRMLSLSRSDGPPLRIKATLAMRHRQVDVLPTDPGDGEVALYRRGRGKWAVWARLPDGATFAGSMDTLGDAMTFLEALTEPVRHPISSEKRIADPGSADTGLLQFDAQKALRSFAHLAGEAMADWSRDLA